MYRLDLETLRLLLKGRSGTLEAVVESIPGLKGQCQAHVTLSGGKIVACQLRDQRGNVLTGEAAQRLLAKKVVEWSYQEQQPPVERPRSAPAERLPAVIPQYSPHLSATNGYLPRVQPGYRPLSIQTIPRRTDQRMPAQIHSWPRLHRSAFLLIDGVRSVGTIAQLLGHDEGNIALIIGEMGRQNLVIW